MRFSDIIDRGKSYLFLGLVSVAAISILVFVGYFVIYKKLMKGKKTFPLYRLVLFDIFICYMIVVAGAVFLDRSVGMYKWSNLNFLSSYREAWYGWSSVDWRHIILNIMMFIPMGILLPLLTQKLQKLWKVLIIGFSMTLFIECAQYFTGLGIFEIDDIFNNFLGVMIGGGIIMGIINFRKLREKEKPIFKALIYFPPLFMTVLGFASIFIFYNIKEFGNIGTYFNKYNMNGIELSCEIELTDDKPMAGVYSTEMIKEADARAFAKSFFARMGASFDPNRLPQIYDESAYYYSDNHHHLTVNYNAATYRYTDFTLYDLEEDSSAQETEIRDLLLDFNINVPDDAEYNNRGNGDYYFSVNMSNNGGYIVDGSLNCSYYNDGTLNLS